MRLKHITFTGIDAKTDITALEEIQKQYPIAEFGVLTSYHWYENGNRYLNPSFMSNLYAGNGELNLALHICGSAAHDATVGMWQKIDEHLFGTLSIFKRIQLNVANRKDNPNRAIAPSFPHQELILQQRNPHEIDLFIETIKRYGFLNKTGFSMLLDASGGRGIDTPIEIVKTDVKVGYAGGINPDNVADKLEYLFENVPGDFWIDMESGVRTNDWFDIDKVIRVLEICYKILDEREEWRKLPKDKSLFKKQGGTLMKSKYSPGEILFNESSQKPFIHDGNKTADGLGVVIGFAHNKDKLVLCRTSGYGNFQTTAEVRPATDEEKEWLMNQIAIAKDIPFYSCIP